MFSTWHSYIVSPFYYQTLMDRSWYANFSEYTFICRTDIQEDQLPWLASPMSTANFSQTSTSSFSTELKRLFPVTMQLKYKTIEASFYFKFTKNRVRTSCKNGKSCSELLTIKLVQIELYQLKITYNNMRMITFLAFHI